MGWDIQNGWPDIAELRSSDQLTDSKFATETVLRVELRTNVYELELEAGSVTVGFSRLTMQVECEGTEIGIGDRFGEAPIENEIRSTQTEQTAVVKKAGISGTLGGSASAVPALDVSVRASGEAEASSSKTIDSKRENISRYVTAKPNNKWEISSLDGTALDKKYISHSDEICSISPKINSNRQYVAVHLFGHKKDIVLQGTMTKETKFPLFSSANKNKEKIFKVLAARCLRTQKDILTDSVYVSLLKVESREDDI